jgi:hypothetical protein
MIRNSAIDYCEGYGNEKNIWKDGVSNLER